MAGKPECDTGKSKERDRVELGLLPAVTAVEDGAFPLRTHSRSTLALACPESAHQQA